MFKKYFSIENHYNEKFINYAIEHNSDIVNANYIITEKIHGANISFIFTPLKPMKHASRSQITDSSFYGIGEVFPKYENVFKALQNYSDENNCTINLFGEFFGNNIQKGVDYGKEKRFLFFDMLINEKLLTQCEFLELFNKLNISNYIVPVIAVVKTLSAALAVPTNFNSKLIDKEDNICEGVVVKPFDKIIYAGNDIFYIKIKNDKFLERKAIKKIDIRSGVDDIIVALNNSFKDYINDNRVQSIFSKYGTIQNKSDIGKYISLILNDAKEDFIKDNSAIDFNNFSKESLKFIFNISKNIMPLLSKYI